MSARIRWSEHAIARFVERIAPRMGFAAAKALLAEQRDMEVKKPAGMAGTTRHLHLKAHKAVFVCEQEADGSFYAKTCITAGQAKVNRKKLRKLPGPRARS